ncbi:MAG: AtpZ/AtpI family protein [Anaerolineae bacterium]
MTKKRDEKPWFHELGRASSLGWDLALPIFGGVLLGHYLDGRWGTDYVFTVGLLFLGVMAGFYSIWRFSQRL